MTEITTEVRSGTLQPDEGSQVMALFQQAVDRGVTAETLEKLVALHDRVQRRRAELEFSDALADFQAHCPPIPRTSSARIATKGGGEFSYKYADFEQVTETVGPHLHSRRFSYTFDSDVTDGTLKCVCTLRHANGHSISAGFSLPVESASAMSPQQKVGAALSFAKRQAFIAVLGLSLTDPDPDGSLSPEAVSEEQAANVSGLIEETGADLGRFLNHFGIRDVPHLRVSQYGEAVRILEKRRKVQS